MLHLPPHQTQAFPLFPCHRTHAFHFHQLRVNFQTDGNILHGTGLHIDFIMKQHDPAPAQQPARNPHGGKRGFHDAAYAPPVKADDRHIHRHPVAGAFSGRGIRESPALIFHKQRCGGFTPPFHSSSRYSCAFTPRQFVTISCSLFSCSPRSSMA